MTWNPFTFCTQKYVKHFSFHKARFGQPWFSAIQTRPQTFRAISFRCSSSHGKSNYLSTFYKNSRIYYGPEVVIWKIFCHRDLKFTARHFWARFWIAKDQGYPNSSRFLKTKMFSDIDNGGLIYHSTHTYLIGQCHPHVIVNGLCLSRFALKKDVRHFSFQKARRIWTALVLSYSKPCSKMSGGKF